MKLSVIVTTYNRPHALKRVLEGLFCQTLRPHEILVADDGSNEETRDLVDRYRADSPVSLVHVWQPDKGFRLSRIRNKAIRKATGEYLVILDGDCIPERHFVADHAALARPGCFFQGKRVLVNQKAETAFEERDANSFLRKVLHAVRGNISNAHHIVRMPALPAYTTAKLSGIRGCNMAFYKQDLIGVNGYNEAFTGWGREDQEIVARLFRYGIQRQEHPFRAICYHLWHPENPRTRLDENDRLLAQALASETWVCEQGLAQLENDV